MVGKAKKINKKYLNLKNPSTTIIKDFSSAYFPFKSEYKGRTDDGFCFMVDLRHFVIDFFNIDF